MALTNRPDTKFPSYKSSLFLNRMAQEAGLDIASLQKEQQARVDSRQKSQTDRIASLEKKIAELEVV
jgi:hypothetical protein